MKTTIISNKVLCFCLLVIFCIPLNMLSQSNRIKPPKRISKVESADDFVKKSFELYEKVFVYDSLTQVGVEIPKDLEDQLTESAKADFDHLVEIVPDVADDIANAKILWKAKALLNLKKAKKALQFCGTTITGYFINGREED